LRLTIAPAIAGIAIFGLAACSGGSVVPTSSLANNASTRATSGVTSVASLVPANGYIPFASANPVRALCPRPMGVHGIRCFALMRTDMRPSLAPDASVGSQYGYSPADLQSAYALPSKTAGKGQTIALIESYGYTQAAGDLATYRKAFGLPACTIANVAATGPAAGQRRLARRTGSRYGYGIGHLSEL
jgi:hypothetical protein